MTINATVPSSTLCNFIEQRQRRAIETYLLDIQLLEEHVNQEESYRSGGYGTRQISELLQNAVDAIRGTPDGQVEFRLADGNLYCANTGDPFDEEGITAVTYSFLSSKKEDEIGRFGLGFKSVLGVTSRPMIYSRLVSFGFGDEAAIGLFQEAGISRANYPLLRVPTLLNVEAGLSSDPNLADLFTWATTVVKLPLERDGARLRRELEELERPAILFLKELRTLRIALQANDGQMSISEISRFADPERGEIKLTHVSNAREESLTETWLYAESEYSPTPAVRSSLPATMLRETMTVSYAIESTKRGGQGQLWSWFPLLDVTTASGIFNAPWQINDDRTSLVRASALNGDLLEVSAKLFLEVMTRMSSTKDPGGHLDQFPGRGKEILSDADRFLTTRIPQLAGEMEILPDSEGRLRKPSYFRGVPDLEENQIPGDIAKLWQERVTRLDFPHWQVFQGPSRRSRVRALLSRHGKPDSIVSLQHWLEELAQAGGNANLEVSLGIIDGLQRDRMFKNDPGLLSAKILPLKDGGFASLSEKRSVLIPSGENGLDPDGVQLLSRVLLSDSGIIQKLKSHGFTEVSADQVLLALSNLASPRWAAEEWRRFWLQCRACTPIMARKSVLRVVERGIAPLLLAKDGNWIPASQAILNSRLLSSRDDLHPDFGLVPDKELLVAAGVGKGASDKYPLYLEPCFGEYQRRQTKFVADKMRKEGLAPIEIVIPAMYGVGPLQPLFEDLVDSERAEWVSEIISRYPTMRQVLLVPVSGTANNAEITIWRPERQALLQKGLFQTSLGLKRSQEVVSHKLIQFVKFLPVAGSAESGLLGFPATLEEITDKQLGEFLLRENYEIQPEDYDAFAELMRACSVRFRAPEAVPAILNNQVMLCIREEVAVTEAEDNVQEMAKEKQPFVPTAGDHADLVADWGLITSEEAMQLTHEIHGMSELSSLVDSFPSLPTVTSVNVRKVQTARAKEIYKVLRTTQGLRQERLSFTKQAGVVVVDEVLTGEELLKAISDALSLGLSYSDAREVLERDERLRHSQLIADVKTAATNEERLLMLAGRDHLADLLPEGLLKSVESKRGELTGLELAELFLRLNGNDSLRRIREVLPERNIIPPLRWDGSSNAQKFVKMLGFDTRFAGMRESSAPSVTQVAGNYKLNPLHDFQRDAADKIRELVIDFIPDTETSRALLYLPTGAGKTRVTVESILQMMKSGELASPILWIAQTEELCEQAIQAFAEVWGWLGDSRTLDLSRFWSGHELDESEEDLHVVVAIDDTLKNKLSDPNYEWLRDCSLVVIDEAHVAAPTNPSYTEILRNLGITGWTTARPLLGLTATPFRGRNDEVNKNFAARFKNNRIDSLDPTDPIGELRRRRVLAEVDHRVLEGMSIFDSLKNQQFVQMREVTRMMLDEIGQDISRNERVVEDIKNLDPSWPVLVFAASVASAHTIAALLRLDDISADAVDGTMRKQERRRIVEQFKKGDTRVLVNCDLFTQGFDAPKVRALYVARPTFSPNRYLQMVGRGLRGPLNGGTERCLIVNIADTFDEFGEDLAFNEFNYLWSAK